MNNDFGWKSRWIAMLDNMTIMDEIPQVGDWHSVFFHGIVRHNQIIRVATMLPNTLFLRQRSAIIRLRRILLLMCVGLTITGIFSSCVKKRPCDQKPVSHSDVSLMSEINAATIFAQKAFGGESISAFTAFSRMIDSVAGECRSRLAVARSLLDSVDVIRQQVYGAWGLSFDANQDTAWTIFPHTALLHHRGSCVGVSLLTILLARRAGMPAAAVLLPNHFFVRFGKSGAEINFEPNRSGWRYTDDEYRTKYRINQGIWYSLRSLTDNEIAGVLWYSLGNCCRVVGKMPKAAECYQRAILLFPDYAEAYGNLGIALEAQGLQDSALGALLQAQKLRPDLPNSAANIGSLLCRMKRFSQAKRVYHAGLTNAPDDPQLLFGLGYVLLMSGNSDSARVVLRRACGIGDGMPEAKKLLDAMEH